MVVVFVVFVVVVFVVVVGVGGEKVFQLLEAILLHFQEGEAQR